MNKTPMTNDPRVAEAILGGLGNALGSVNQLVGYQNQLTEPKKAPIPQPVEKPKEPELNLVLLLEDV